MLSLSPVMSSRTILDRVANALYWTGFAIGSLFLAAAIAAPIFEPNVTQRSFEFGIFAALALLSWGAGRVSCYILSGR